LTVTTVTTVTTVITDVDDEPIFSVFSTFLWLAILLATYRSACIVTTPTLQVDRNHRHHCHHLVLSEGKEQSKTNPGCSQKTVGVGISILF
jgi:hypothetical protein